MIAIGMAMSTVQRNDSAELECYFHPDDCEKAQLKSLIMSRAMETQIRETVLSIIMNRSHVDFKSNPELMKELLFGEKIKLPTRELLWIYFDIERILGVSISPNDIEEGKFKTAEKIVMCITDAIQSKSMC